jgi:hypothetical protein
MSCAMQCNIKASEKGEPILHWELPHSVPCGCDTMHQMFNQGLNIDHLECDDCPSEDESDAPSLVPHHLSKSVSSSEPEHDKFGEDPWDDLEFMTHQCNSIKISHILSEPIENPHDCEDDLNNVIGTHVHRVTPHNGNIYRPQSIDDSTMDLKLSKVACESP